MTSGLTQILYRLQEEQIDFILVGGMAAVLHGAPFTTLDIDIVHSRESQNVERLLRFLTNINARYRGQPRGRIIQPTKSALSGSGHNNLSTDLGPLDILCELSLGQSYEQLLPHTEVISDGKLNLRVLTLAKLIEIKADTGRDKDRMMIPVLMKLLKS